jgi:hypothetical protein
VPVSREMAAELLHRGHTQEAYAASFDGESLTVRLTLNEQGEVGARALPPDPREFRH